MPGNIINLTPEDVAKWPTPNYTDPHRRRWMPAYAGILYGVATVMGATRLWLRAKQRGGGLGIDDVSTDGESSKNQEGRILTRKPRFSSSAPGLRYPALQP